MSAETMKGKVDLDGTREALEHLGLEFAAEALTDLLTEAVKEDLPVHRFLDKVLAAELSRRDERRVWGSRKPLPSRSGERGAWVPPPGAGWR